MEELRLVGADDNSAVVLRVDPQSPLRDVGAAIQLALGTTSIPILGDVPLMGAAPFGSLEIEQGDEIDWAPAGSVEEPVSFVATCIAGADTGRSWPIAGPEAVIGRDEECQIAVTDHSVSRRHTRLSIRAEGIVIEDLGSTNGTELNGKRIDAPAVLQAGDRIRIGTTTLELATIEATPPVASRPISARQSDQPRATPLRLCIVGGPDSGRTFPIEQSTITVGRGPGVDVAVADPLLSRQHFTLSFNSGAVSIQDLGSSNGTTLDGFALDGTFALRSQSIIRAGDQLFAVRPAAIADAVLGAMSSGRSRYDRIARIRSYPPTPTVAVPVEPTPQEKPPFPWPIVIAPLLLAVAMAFFFKRPEALLFALLTPVMAVSTNMTYRRSVGRRSTRDAAEYEAALAEMHEILHNAAFEQTSEQWRSSPDACLVADTARGPGARLWERRLSDDDTLVVRVGTSPSPADVQLTGRADMAPPQMANVPVSVDLAVAGVTSLAGTSEQVRPLARWILAQLMTLVSPTDLTIGVLTQPDAEADWAWLGWATHARMAEANGVRLGNDTQTIETRVAALTARLDERQQQRSEQRIDTFAPLVLTVIDNSREFRRVPGVLRLLEEGPDVGLFFLTLDLDTNRTPGEAQALLAFDRVSDSYFRLEVSGQQPRDAVLSEGVSPAWIYEVARSTAAIEPATDDAAAQIPNMVRYADLIEMDVEDDAPLLAAWSAGARTTRAIVGATSEGAFSVDIAHDGPHAFIAGTTGSGKTELLLTFITALALGNRPEALNVIVVDWKGGGDFVELGGLPHTVGMVTNLDGHLAKRALASLQAEVGRRQTMLKTFKEDNLISESNIGSVWDEQAELASEHGLGRLVIIVDEFAELAQSIPEFLAGLVRIARVGRALGIHLVLATQRPRGVITGDLSANVGLRLVLRTESGESREVLESDHADHISRRTRGRGFVRYGDPARLVEFQTARVAGRRPGAVVGLQPPLVDLIGWRDMGYALRRPPQPDDQPDADSTDLRALVDMTQRVATSMSLKPPPSPWLAPLPNHVDLAELAAPAGSLAAPFGLIDEPSSQSQRPILFDLENDGHLAIAGSSGSGRSTALRTLAASLAKQVAPADCNIYGFDFGNGGLLALSDLPHVGAIVRASEPDRVARVLDRLSAEVTSRQAFMGKVQAGNIADQRALDPQNALAHIVVLVDRWDSFVSQYPLDTQAHQIILRLARDGLGVGIHLVMSGDRSLLGGRMGGEFERKLMLPFADRDDYRDGRLRPQDLPEVIAAGRGFMADSGAEVQIAAIGTDDSGVALRQSIGAIAHVASADPRRATSELIRVEALPTTVSFNDVWRRINPARVTSPLTALVGVGGDDLSPELIDFTDVGPGFTVAGPPGTGRSTALVSIARSVLAFGAQVIAVMPRTSPLGTIPSDSLHVVAPADLNAEDLVTRFSTGPTLLIVDDVHLLSADQSVLLRGVVDAYSAGSDFGFAVAGDIDKLSLLPVAIGARRSGSGLLLSPRNLDRDLLSLSALPSTVVGRQPPGRGFLARRSNGHEVHVVS